MKNLKETLLEWFKHDYSHPAISRQALFSQFLIFYYEQKYKGSPIKGISHYRYPVKAFYQCCDFLLQDEEIFVSNLTPKGFNYIYKLSEQKDPLFEERIVCSIYPYGYLTYLSAMRAYKLTSLNSNTIHFISTDRETWKRNALHDFDLKFNEDYGISSNDFPQHLIIPTFPNEHKILDKDLITFTQKNLEISEFNKNNKSLKIEDILSLFISMTRKPHLCGGYQNVLDVFSKNIDVHFKDLIEYLDHNGSEIDKVRFGFILNKKLNKNHKIIDKWKFQQEGKRGSSRKLISSQPFSDRFDPEWNLSLNYKDTDDYVKCNVKKLIVTTKDLTESDFQKIFGPILIFNSKNIRDANFGRNTLIAEFSFEHMISHEILFFEKREAIIRQRLKELFNSEEITFEYIYRDKPLQDS